MACGPASDSPLQTPSARSRRSSDQHGARLWEGRCRGAASAEPHSACAPAAHGLQCWLAFVFSPYMPPLEAGRSSPEHAVQQLLPCADTHGVELSRLRDPMWARLALLRDPRRQQSVHGNSLVRSHADHNRTSQTSQENHDETLFSGQPSGAAACSTGHQHSFNPHTANRVLCAGILGCASSKEPGTVSRECQRGEALPGGCVASCPAIPFLPPACYVPPAFNCALHARQVQGLT